MKSMPLVLKKLSIKLIELITIISARQTPILLENSAHLGSKTARWQNRNADKTSVDFK